MNTVRKTDVFSEKSRGCTELSFPMKGESVDEIRKDFEGAVDDYLLSCKARGIEPAKPYSGKLNLRMPSELHAAIANAAISTGTTINEFINRSMRGVLHLEPAH